MIHGFGLMHNIHMDIIHTLLKVKFIFVHLQSIFLCTTFIYDIHFALNIGKYYLVDSGYPNRVGYLAPYRNQRYHVPEFQQALQEESWSISTIFIHLYVM